MLQKPTESSQPCLEYCRVPLPLLNPYINPSSPSPTVLFSSYPAVHWKGRDSSGFLGGEEKL